MGVPTTDLDEIESLKRATNMAHAAKEAGLEHVIWS